MTFRRAYAAFLRGASAGRIAQAGVVIVTATVISFLVMQLAMLGGLVTNQYVGLVVYLAFPVLFLGGLTIIPLGWYLYARKHGLGLWELIKSRFREEEIEARAVGAPVARTIVLLTLANLAIFGVATISTLHYMDKPEFCGTACHDVMNPEWATYQASPHARVACVECHVGEGVDALIDSKLNGLWQVISRTFNLYEKPIPTPVHQLRPARETCEHCHWPEIDLPDRLVKKTHYAHDEANTPSYTTLLMKVGSGREGVERGSHWHTAETNEVRYASLDDQRLQMLWVEARQPDGSWRRWENDALAGRELEIEPDWARTMDCIDCHNRATHIYERPDDALDEAIAGGRIDPALPGIKRRALAVLLPAYPDTSLALRSIEAGIRGSYKRDPQGLPQDLSRELNGAIEEVKEIWRRNVHPEMELYWGAYPNHLGHRNGPGCFRCHTEEMVEVAGPGELLGASMFAELEAGAATGSRLEPGDASQDSPSGSAAGTDGDQPRTMGASIPSGCTLCHSILAWESESPDAFLGAPAEQDSSRDRAMHSQLSRELREHLQSTR